MSEQKEVKLTELSSKLGWEDYALERDRQLRSALTQIADLTKQFEGIGVEQYLSMKVRAEKVESELATARGAMAAQDSREVVAGIKCSVFYSDHGCDWPDAVADEVLKLKAEIAAMREGVVGQWYRVEGPSDDGTWTHLHQRSDKEQAVSISLRCKGSRVIEIITRERILDEKGEG